MKAAVFDGKEIKITMVNEPVIKKAQVLVRVKAVGICGTDLAIVQGDLPTFTPINSLPGRQTYWANSCSKP